MRVKAIRVAAAVGIVVVSHWVLDFVTHRPDLPLWPGGPEVGLGLWNSIAGTLLVEGSIFIAAIVFYTRSVKSRDRTGSWALWGLTAFTGIIWFTQPWSPPAPNSTVVAVTALTLWDSARLGALDRTPPDSWTFGIAVTFALRGERTGSGATSGIKLPIVR